MIYYGAQLMFILIGIVFALIVLYIITAIVMLFLKWRMKKDLKEWEKQKKELEENDA